MSKGKRISEESKRSMEELRRAGSSYREIHEKLGVPSSTISRYCRHIEPRKERENNFPYKDSYKNRWARTHGYESFFEYQRDRSEKRKTLEENQRMARLIAYGLEQVRKTQNPPKFQNGYSWLARKIGVSWKAVGFYASGALLPRPGIAEKIFETLGVDYESLKAVEQTRQFSSKENPEDEVVTIKDLSLAIKSSRPAMEYSEAKQTAEIVMNRFGFYDTILDNSLDPDVRDVFYNLQDEGLLKSEREETSLLSGKQWRIHYWKLRKDRILELAKTREEAQTPADEDLSGIYREVPNDDWIGGLRAIDKETEPEGVV